MNSKVAGFMFVVIIVIAGFIFVLNSSTFNNLTKGFTSTSSSTHSGFFSGKGFFPIPQIPQNQGLNFSSFQGQPVVGSQHNTEIGSSGNTQNSVPADIPAGFTAKQISPSYHKVRISSVNRGFSNTLGSIRLSASFDGSG